MSRADEIRALHTAEPALSMRELATRLGVPYSAVQSALRRVSGQRGRPVTDPGARVLLRVRDLPERLLVALRARHEDEAGLGGGITATVVAILAAELLDEQTAIEVIGEASREYR